MWNTPREGSLGRLSLGSSFLKNPTCPSECDWVDHEPGFQPWKPDTLEQDARHRCSHQCRDFAAKTPTGKVWGKEQLGVVLWTPPTINACKVILCVRVCFWTISDMWHVPSSTIRNSASSFSSQIKIPIHLPNKSTACAYDGLINGDQDTTKIVSSYHLLQDCHLQNVWQAVSLGKRLISMKTERLNKALLVSR